ncbi:YciI family protein [Xylanimonas sp. McL0601]|uniref:YciI family protein n=1 Tax=Xylanimonas sp. McL0601 TaxID=3414739 RepID=UPI003CEFBECE
MRYVVLIHSNPQPWGHPTIDFTAEGRGVPADRRAADGAAFEAFLSELSARDELVAAEALAEPASSTLWRWSDGAPATTDGPYTEAAEHLAGFFLLDVATPERAHEVARQFAGPGDTIELRPAYVWPS